MRTSVLMWRKYAASCTLTAALLSGFQLTGCIPSSSRNAANISSRAADSARRAEREIAIKNSESTKDVVNTQADMSANQVGVAKVSDYAKRDSTLENPLAKLLSEQPENYPAGDPFLKSDDVVQAGERPAANSHASFSEKEATADSGIQLTEHQGRAVFTGREDAVVRPFSSVELKNLSTEGSRSSLAAPGPRSFPGNDSSDSVAAKPGLSTAGSRSPEITSAQDQQPQMTASWAKDQASLTADSGRSQWPGSVSGTVETPSTETKQSDPAASQRIEALLQQADQLRRRGELHAAYRSALLAQSMVDRHGLSVTELRRNPHVLASELAAQIWGAPNAEQTAKAGKKKSDLPIIQPRGSRSPQHDQVFQTADNYLNWQSSQKSPVDASSVIQLTGAARKNEFEVTGSNIELASEQHAATKRPDSLLSPKGLSEDNTSTKEAISPKPFSPERWGIGEVAVVDQAALNDRPTARPMPSSAKPSPFAVEFASPSGRSEVAAATSIPAQNGGPGRKPLSAPTIPKDPFGVDFAPELELLTPDVANNESDSAIESVTDDAGHPLLWGAIAFILAVVSTAVGLKLSKPKLQTQSSEAVSETEKSDDENRPPLKFSKAA